MSLLGTHMTLLMGPSVPVPAPPTVLEAFARARVTHDDEARSGFEIVFKVGRTSADLLDYALMVDPLLQPMNRIILVVTLNLMPRVLMDGIVTNRQSPGSASGVIFVTLEDETGILQVIVWPQLAQRERSILLSARLLAVEGEVQREGEVLHVIARRLQDHSHLLGRLVTRSRDFH